MPQPRHASDYQPVLPLRARAGGDAAALDWPAHEPAAPDEAASGDARAARADSAHAPPAKSESSPRVLRRGHALSFAGLFAFTLVLYFRPYELVDSLSSLTSMALACALFTLAAYLPTQLLVEGNLTAPHREVKLLLLLTLCALLSMPLAISPADAWAEFTGVYVKAVLMFVVMVNVLRTRRRLTLMMLLAVAVGCSLAVDAVVDYRAGRFALEGARIAGLVGGMFGNPNDMALHLVTMMPLSLALALRTRNPLAKLVYFATVPVMVAGVVVSFSRGGFIALVGIALVLGWKLGRRHRLAVLLSLALAGALFVALAPGDYGTRIVTIFDSNSDPTGSSQSRKELLIRSLVSTAANPVFGLGMGNFAHVGFHNKVSHNAYTQVSAEMGVAALVFYVLFMIAPLRALRRIERETLGDGRRRSRYYYHLSVGLQASLAGYLIGSFFASVAYQFYIYYLVGYAVALRTLYESETAAAAAAESKTPAADFNDQATDGAFFDRAADEEADRRAAGETPEARAY